jgi:hypothetical protein
VTTNPVKDVMTFWDGLYLEHVGARYPFNAGRDSKWIKDWRAVYSDEELQAFMAAFFVIEDDFIQNSGYGLGVFRGCLPKVIQFVKRGARQVEKPMTTFERERARQIRTAHGHCPHDPDCGSYSACLATIVRGWRSKEIAS